MLVSSEADERVQRFYGILPKEVKGEVKTPRMVKQASKKNSKVNRSKGSGEEDSESLEVRILIIIIIIIIIIIKAGRRRVKALSSGLD